mgnify:CR=1 FL=1
MKNEENKVEKTEETGGALAIIQGLIAMGLLGYGLYVLMTM